MRVRSAEEKLNVTQNPWFYVPKPNCKAKLKLFCFPYAGGTAEIYYAWPYDLPEEIEMLAIHYPGHIPRSNERLFTRISKLVEAISGEIVRYTDKSYAFFGHSMGALVAYELSRRFASEGRKMPEYLFLSARRAPHIPVIHPHMHKLTKEEWISVMRCFNMVPEEVIKNMKLLEKILPVIKADFEMVETWQFDAQTPPLDIPVCVFGGINDNLAPKKDIEAWEKMTRKKFNAYFFPEKHFFIMKDEVRIQLITILVNMLKPFLK
ncbi:MAG: thioesterase [Thermoplasmata archaeon]|nr:MAG: thioesterase [Thermoplasmata archaeon]